MNLRSIRARLTIFAFAFLAIVVGLATVAGERFIAVDRTATRLAQTDLATSQLLGGLSDQIAEFRLAETYRALTIDPKLLPGAELNALAHRQTIEAIETQYVTLTNRAAEYDPDFIAFRNAMTEYFRMHDSWVKSDPNGNDRAPAYVGSALYRLYTIADAAIERLVQTNAAQTAAAERSVNRTVKEALGLIVALSGAAVLLAAGLMLRVHTSITRPLAQITSALSKLAAGNRDVRVPEVGRDDEIGQMAKAFDVFRANARALEEAHAVAEAAQEQIQSLARHDGLTGLANRGLFAAELKAALSHVTVEGGTCSVFIINLDHFKQVNDLRGHPVGDLVLCEVAERLRKMVRGGDTVARLGSDEFAIIVPNGAQQHPQKEMRLAQRVIDAISNPIHVRGVRIDIGASVGIALAPADGVDAEDLTRAADIAMYRAKRDGRGAFRFFEQSMDEELRTQAALEADLRKAVIEHAIRPQYQPIVNLRNNSIYGFEVLARWQHPARGWVSPEVFVPLAERLGLIAPLTAWLLHQACHETVGWDDNIRLSFNISPYQLKDPALPMQLLTILNQEGFPPSRLEIEITETALVSDIETARHILTALQAIGIKISLDDFGTGYSSLSHLHELKFDKVKIDRSFVQSMRENPESEKIVDAILGLAHSIGMRSIAEGIETQEARQRLADKGCEYGQGYLFGKAMPATDAAALIRSSDFGPVLRTG